MPPAAASASGAGGHHLVLLAKDYAGWSNLCRIISAAHLEHPGEPPVARLATLTEHGGHLVALSGCRRGEVWSRLLAGDKAGARAAASVFHDIFGRDFFIELQHELLPDSGAGLRDARPPRPRAAPPHSGHQRRPLHGQGRRRPARRARRRGRQPAAAQPAGAQERRALPQEPGADAPPLPALPRGRTPMQRASPRAATSTSASAASSSPPTRCRRTRPPSRCSGRRCFEGAAERYRPLTAEVTARLERELKVVEELGFAEYFLAVRDIVEFARARGIYYSGRGSAGNSIVSYVLRITDADPIEHDLLFERFLNPARREMPDVDIDFCSARRDEVIEYIYERFGHDKVAMVATVNTVRAPSAVRMVAAPSASRRTRSTASPGAVPWGSAAKLGEMLAERPELANHEFQQPALPPPRRRRRAPLRLPGPPRHAPGRVHPLARPAHRPRAVCSGPPRASWWPSSTRTTSRRWASSRWTSSPSRCTRPSPRRCAASRRAPASRCAPGSSRATTPRSTSSSARRAPSGCSSSRARGSATWPRVCRSATSRTSSRPSRSSGRGRCRPT